MLSIEIKTKVDDLAPFIALLKEKNARYIGEDHQTDTYFKVKSGRLKLRQGNIENTLIRYHRPESKSLKASAIQLQKLPAENSGLLQILTDTLGILVQVEKSRKIYFIENIKFHLDFIQDLGYFVEIEALDLQGDKSKATLQKQCSQAISWLKLDQASYIDQSYSDMILSKL